MWISTCPIFLKAQKSGIWSAQCRAFSFKTLFSGLYNNNILEIIVKTQQKKKQKITENPIFAVSVYHGFTSLNDLIVNYLNICI